MNFVNQLLKCAIYLAVLGTILGANSTRGQELDAETAFGQFGRPANWLHTPVFILAVVNDRLILDSEVREKTAAAEKMLRRQYASDPAAFRQKWQLAQQEAVEELVRDEVICREAQVMGLQVPEEYVDRCIADRMRSFFVANTNEFARVLAAQGVTLAELREKYRCKLLVSMAAAKQLENLPLPTEEQMMQFYLSHEPDFKDEEKVRLQMIVINKHPTNDVDAVARQRSEVAVLHERLRNGADFAEEAKLHGEGARAKDGGEWGWVSRDVLRKELADAAFALKPGELSEVIETDQAWFILRIMDRRPASIRPFRQVREEIRKRLVAQQRSAAIHAWMTQLLEWNFVRYFSTALPTNRISTHGPVVSVEIKHIGKSTIGDLAIGELLQKAGGQEASQAAVERNMRALYATGDFYNVRVLARDEDGGLGLTYLVQERPMLSSLEFEGNDKLSSAGLLAVVKSKPGERMDECKLFADMRAIREQYRQSGRPQPSVKYTIRLDESSGQASVTFKITEDSASSATLKKTDRPPEM